MVIKVNLAEHILGRSEKVSAVYFQFKCQLFIYIFNSSVSCLLTFSFQVSAVYWHFQFKCQLFIYILSFSCLFTFLIKVAPVYLHFKCQLFVYIFGKEKAGWKIVGSSDFHFRVVNKKKEFSCTLAKKAKSQVSFLCSFS